MSKFKYNAFIENSKEAQEWLNSLGIKARRESFKKSDIIFTYDGSYQGLQHANIGFLVGDGDFVDCRNNLNLFKAISAIREDSDIYQWFTDGKNWVRCYGSNFCEWIIQQKGIPLFALSLAHKATIEELVNYFKE